MTLDPSTFQEILEALIYVFAPFLFWVLVLLGAGAVLSGIGVVILSVVRHMTR